jgi:hypothetical protein
VLLPDGGLGVPLACAMRDVMDVQIEGPFTGDGSACCYEIRYDCFVYVGRAFLSEEGLVRATHRRGAGWMFGPAPDVSSLSSATRRALAAAWVKDGLFEHASVGTFSRFALQLLALGAPAELLHETLAAARDEVRHAELCFALASAYAGEPLEPDALPVPTPLPLDARLVDMVVETVIEGCIGETLAAAQAMDQLAVARDPAVRHSLESTLEDETRHAELAWKVVAWALEKGGDPVRRAVERAFTGFRTPETPFIDLAGASVSDLEAHGRLLPHAARASALEALYRVVRPCAAALLGRDVLPVRRTAA